MIVVLVILASVLLIACIPTSGQLSFVNDKAIPLKRKRELNDYSLKIVGDDFSVFDIKKVVNAGVVRHQSKPFYA
ncbi:MAG: hypothetical protein ABI480_12845 [Chitinophagaceae bacterium]